MSRSAKAYLGFLLLYSFSVGLSLYLPQGDNTGIQLPTQDLPAPRIVMAFASGGIVFVAYGLLGFLGLKLSRKVGFPELWDASITNRRRFLIPGLAGTALGVFLILGDLVFSRFNDLGRFAHPPFPTSIIASFTAGFGEELLFRLFFLSFWYWFIAFVILKRRWTNQIFWAVSGLSALAFALGHYPAFMVLFGYGSIVSIPWVLQAEIILLNCVIAMFAAYYFRRAGFLAAVSVHFWADIVWHVIYGLL